MIKTRFFSSLCAIFLAGITQAKALPNCYLESNELPEVSSCILNKQDIDVIKEYFAADSEHKRLSFNNVQISKEMSQEFVIMASQARNLIELSLYKTTFDSATLPNLINNSHLTSFVFNRNNFLEADLLSLASGKKYSYLSLDEPNLSGQGLGIILDGSQTDALLLESMQFSNDDMNAIFGKHDYLKFVWLRYCKVSSLKAFEQLSNLQKLRLDNLPLSKQDIQVIGQLSNLQFLHLNEIDLDAKDAFIFSKLTNLENLSLRNVFSHHQGIGDEGAKFISLLPNLKILYLTEQGIADAGAIALSRDTTLTKLMLTDNNIGDEGAIALTQLPHLEMLALNKNKIGDRGGIALANSRDIDYLDLDQNNFTDKTAYAFAATTAKIRYLIIEDNHFSKAAIAAMKKNPNIRMVE